MEVKRIGPDGGFIREFTEFRNRVKSLETKPAGTIVIRESLTTTDPETGVSTTIGQLPDGSYGLQQFIGDIEPPPVATAPLVSPQPGTFVITWDGSFVASAAKPKDFNHLNIMAQKMVSGSPSGSPVEVGAIRLQVESVFVTTDVCAVGETWRFYFQSEDYNGNISAASANSPSVAMLSAVTDIGINAALAGIQTDIISASNKAVSAQNAAATAQTAADLANNKVIAMLNSGRSLALNGDFELAGNAGWMFFSGTSIGTSTGTARSGTQCLIGTLSAGNRYAYTDYIAGATGRTYYVEYYVRLRETLVAGNESLQLGAYFSYLTVGGASSAAATYGTGLNAVPLTMGELSTTTWKKFSTTYTFTTADITKVRFGPRLPGAINLGNTLEVDDFKVIDITEAAAAQTTADQAFSQAVSAASAAGSAQSTG